MNRINLAIALSQSAAMLALASGLALSPAAFADDLVWRGPNQGDWFLAANWKKTDGTAGRIPTAADTVLFDSGGSGVIYISAAAPNVAGVITCVAKSVNFTASKTIQFADNMPARTRLGFGVTDDFIVGAGATNTLIRAGRNAGGAAGAGADLEITTTNGRIENRGTFEGGRGMGAGGHGGWVKLVAGRPNALGVLVRGTVNGGAAAAGGSGNGGDVILQAVNSDINILGASANVRAGAGSTDVAANGMAVGDGGTVNLFTSKNIVISREAGANTLYVTGGGGGSSARRGGDGGWVNFGQNFRRATNVTIGAGVQVLAGNGGNVGETVANVIISSGTGGHVIGYVSDAMTNQGTIKSGSGGLPTATAGATRAAGGNAGYIWLEVSDFTNAGTGVVQGGAGGSGVGRGGQTRCEWGGWGGDITIKGMSFGTILNQGLIKAGPGGWGNKLAGAPSGGQADGGVVDIIGNAAFTNTSAAGSVGTIMGGDGGMANDVNANGCKGGDVNVNVNLDIINNKVIQGGKAGKKIGGVSNGPAGKILLFGREVKAIGTIIRDLEGLPGDPFVPGLPAGVRVAALNGVTISPDTSVFADTVNLSTQAGTIRATGLGFGIYGRVTALNDLVLDAGCMGAIDFLSIQPDVSRPLLVCRNSAYELGPVHLSSVPMTSGYSPSSIIIGNVVYDVHANADFDGDGTVDFFDYDAFVACFEGLFCPPGKTADFDGDGTVDFFDYDAYVTAFEGGC
ncbi:MAG: hypothetical protein AABZ53_04785 [Planctomycetota bacterium]